MRTKTVQELVRLICARLFGEKSDGLDDNPARVSFGELTDNRVEQIREEREKEALEAEAHASADVLDTVQKAASARREQAVAEIREARAAEKRAKKRLADLDRNLAYAAEGHPIPLLVSLRLALYPSDVCEWEEWKTVVAVPDGWEPTTGEETSE